MSGEIPGGTPPPTSFRDINCGVLLYNLLTADLIETSRRLHGFGYNVVPTRAKRPLVNSWKKWQDSRQSIGELESLSWDCADSIAVITGAPEKRLFCIDIDGDETPLEVKEIWIKGLAEIFGLRSQKTPRGFHYFGLLDGEMNSTNISGLLELKARGSFVVVHGPGYEEIDLDPGHLHVIPADKLNRAIEILRRLWRLNLPLDLLCELRARGERSEADMKLFIKLLREGWNYDDIYMAWTLLSDRFITEVRERKHRDPHDYFNLTLEKAKRWLEEHCSGVSEGDGREGDVIDLDSRPLLQVVQNAEPVMWRIEGLIPVKGLGILAGRPGATKSIQALLLAHALASGHKAWDALEVKEKTRVLLIDGENHESIFRQRVEAFKLNPLEDIELSRPNNFRLDLDGHLEKLKEKIVSGGFGVVVIDPLRCFIGEADENDNAVMAKIVYNLKRLAEETNAFILLIHHTRKASELISDPLDELRGSSAITAAADLVFLLKGDGSRKILRTVKNRLGPPMAMELSFEEDGDKLAVKGRQIRLEDALNELEKCAEAVMKYLESVGRARRKEIIEAVPYSRRTIDRVLAKLVRDGAVTKEGHGTYSMVGSSLDDLAE